jgi:predicted Zn-dependent protease
MGCKKNNYFFSWLAVFIFLTAIAFQTTGCIRNPATRKVHARLLSVESEKRIGEEAKAHILQQYQLFLSTPVQTYVDGIGQKLAVLSDRPSIDYDFTILDSDLINAFAAPGGYIFITRGLLESMEDEAELAMVLSHEIAHVTALHGVQMIQKEMGQNALAILGTLGAAIVAGPEAMLMMANTASLFSSLYMLGYSRDRELEADQLGLQYLLRAGYDPRASLRFLKKLESGDNKNLQGWDLYFRTHPPISDRIRIIEHMVGVGEADEKTSFREEYQHIKTYLPSIDLSERGTIRGRLYSNLMHRLSVSVPSNWELNFSRSHSLVSFQTSDHRAQGHLEAVTLSSPTQNAQALATLYAKNAGFHLLNGRDMLNNAGYGYLGRFIGPAATGQGLDIRLFATIRHNKGYVLWCGAPMDQPEKYILDMENILRSFRFDEM